MMIADRRTAIPPSVRWAAVLAAGMTAGAVTSVLQKYLSTPWLSLVNAASPWLAPAFALGTIWPRPRLAALAGAVCGLLELGGYYLTATVRGYPAGDAMVLFWAACALMAGPLFGVAGWAWWHGPAKLSSIGAAVLPAAFLAEAAIGYGWRLHYWSSTILFAIIAIVIFAFTGLRGRQHARLAVWVLALLPAGVAAELALGLFSGQFS
jgi:hypothetical protein